MFVINISRNFYISFLITVSNCINIVVTILSRYSANEIEKCFVEHARYIRETLKMSIALSTSDSIQKLLNIMCNPTVFSKTRERLFKAMQSDPGNYSREDRLR